MDELARKGVQPIASVEDMAEDGLSRVVVLDSDDDVCRLWGEISAAARRRGRPRPQNDSWIAACCLSRALPLATAVGAGSAFRWTDQRMGRPGGVRMPNTLGAFNDLTITNVASPSCALTVMTVVAGIVFPTFSPTKGGPTASSGIESECQKSGPSRHWVVLSGRAAVDG